MQMFFENTEQYAGNFARESTQTISGSLGLMLHTDKENLDKSVAKNPNSFI